ncbi:UDP-N-acetylglucosamine transferase subunit ALG14 [bacterium]|nr:UDP-N-acetylglucosamine transferase subunit ALG14 [bacterium]
MKKRIIAVSSGGGHLSELLRSVPSSYEDKIVYVTFDNGHTKETLKGKEKFFLIDPHVSKVRYLLNFLQSCFVYLKVRPKVIISTGAGIAVPLMLIGVVFNARIVFIESGARVFNPSRTAQFIYKFSDLFVIQYNTLSTIFPRARIASL